MWPDGRPEKLNKLIKERGDKEVLEAIRYRLGRLTAWRDESDSIDEFVDLVLSLRGNIVDGKFVQDEKGQYQVCVVDLKGALPTEISSYFPKMGKRFQEEMLKAGYHRIVGG